MICTLEAFNARHGDALLLHYGPTESPKVIVIDGGPAGVFDDVLRPRLMQLRESRNPDGRLDIRLLMVSHIDDDHIHGVLDLLREISDGDHGGNAFDVVTLWHNSFDDLVAKIASTDVAQHLARARRREDASGARVSDVASVKQGRDLRRLAERLEINVNYPFNGLIACEPGKRRAVPLGDGLSFTVLGPQQDRLDALQNDWVKHIEALRGGKGAVTPAAMDAAAVEFVDRSVYNLSSIIVLAEVDGRRVLLTGDARGDLVLDGLEDAELLADAPLHVDVFKLPHHGSSRNAAEKLFERVTADRYVISADGKYGNPDVETLEYLTTARGTAAYTIHMTNDVPAATKFLKKAKSGKRFKVVIRDDEAPSLLVTLGEPLPE
jgi:beta-lactamase superfamily II metal-dependent hydrolase